MTNQLGTVESEVTLLAASDNENVKEDEVLPECEGLLFKTTKESNTKMGCRPNKMVKRKANEFPGHYPMTRKAKLKACESAPNPTPQTLKYKFSPLSPQNLKSSQTLTKFT